MDEHKITNRYGYDAPDGVHDFENHTLEDLVWSIANETKNALDTIYEHHNEFEYYYKKIEKKYNINKLMAKYLEYLINALPVFFLNFEGWIDVVPHKSKFKLKYKLQGDYKNCDSYYDRHEDDEKNENEKK